MSLDSTVEGGAGPAFAVGNTLDGRTARIAQEAKEVPPVPGDGTGDAAPAPNRTATRIPTVGVKFTQPRVRNPELKPDYPATLKAQGIEGDVTVLVAIDVAGKVTSVKLLGQPSYPEFAEAVRAFVPRLEYDPATRDGEPVATTITFTIRFRIENE
ncbi:MAG: energy transducer TonB [Armatimonadota bacterium]|nr:energy transducer TonB [Armatimonadota bacterium]